MRFVKDGCDIPQDLLDAYLKGEVVFFCGAGVSKAKAKLPDFTELTKKVLDELHIPEDDKIYKLLDFIIDKKNQQQTLMGYSGLISVDKIFSYLERDYSEIEIRLKVCTALKPTHDVDLSAHSIMLKLANHNNKLKLVTTNFDRLFEQADGSLSPKICTPPQLPPLHFGEELDSLVYLHGCVNDDYSDGLNQYFVLSSADFGNAYLSDGWATQFLKSLLDKYHLVFIGYSADDPPVSYLLEALRKSQKNTRIYAFQNASDDEGFLKWQSKGVNPIGFSTYDLLWRSLEDWGNKYNNEDWSSYCLNLATSEPNTLFSYERAQVLQFVSKAENMKQFLELTPPAPASWIFVFDDWLRTNDKEKSSSLAQYKGDNKLQLDREKAFNFYDNYRIENDTIDNSKESQNFNGLNVLKINDKEANIWFGDRTRLDGSLTLSERQNWLLQWIVNHWQSKEVIFWFAFRIKLLQIHPEFFNKFSHLPINDTSNQAILKIWRGLSQIGNRRLSYYSKSHDYEIYTFKNYLKIFGWQLNSMTLLSEIVEPKLTINSYKYYGADSEFTHPSYQVKYVKFDELLHNLTIEESNCFDLCTLFTEALVYGLKLEKEYGCRSYSIYMFDFSQLNGHDSYYLMGADGYILYLAKLFTYLLEHSSSKAIFILDRWSKIEFIEFNKLSLWGFSNNYGEKFAQTVFSDLIAAISTEDLFDYRLRKELSKAIITQWHLLSDEQRSIFEQKIIDGENFLDDSYRKYHDDLVFQWFNLLKEHNLKLSQNYDDMLLNLKQSLEKDGVIKDYDSYFNDSIVKEVSWVRDDTNYSMLNDLPIEEIIPTVHSLKNLRHPDGFTDYAPFEGLCKNEPKRAFLALKVATEKSNINLSDSLFWSWAEFFNVTRDVNLPKILANEIANQLLAYSNAFFVELIRPISHWFEHKIYDEINNEAIVNQFIDKLIEVNKLISNDDITKEDDLDFNAINSLAGSLVHILYKTVKNNELSPIFKNSAQKLLKNTNPNLAYSIFVLVRNLNWLYFQDKDWTIENLLPYAKDRDKKVHLAFWLSFLSSRFPNNELFTLLKNDILVLDVQNIASRSQSNIMERYLSLILQGWLNTIIDRANLITDDEFRESINKYSEYLSSVVQQMKIWSDEEKVLEQIPNFFNRIYPRQNQCKTLKNNRELLALLFNSEQVFNTSFNVILPLLTKSTDQYLDFVFNLVHDENNTIIQNQPIKVLEVLNVILPTNPKHWFHDAHELLKTIENKHPSLKNNAILKRLKTIWHNR